MHKLPYRMDHPRKDSSAKINMSKCQEECQSQVRDLIQKLSSWRDDSHRQMSNIISSHSRGIDKGFNGLVEEFSDLHAQVSVLRKERNVLLETIDNLNNEIRQMGAQLPIAEPEVQEEVSFEMDIPDIKEESVESPMINSDTDVETNGVDYGDVLDHNEPIPNTRYPFDYERHWDISTVNDLENADLSNSDNEETVAYVAQDQAVGSVREKGVSKENKPNFNRKVHGEEFTCKVCKFVFSTSENLRIHLKNAHPKLGKSKVSQDDDEESMEQSNLSLKEAEEWNDDNMSMHQKFQDESYIPRGDKKLKCEQCPYQTSHKSALIRHIRDVHDTIKKSKQFECEKCPFSSARKENLKRHWDAVHNMGDKKFKCEKCPYSSAGKINLKYHMVSVHNMGDKRYKCEKCPYSSAQKGHLKQHIKGVHENVRNHV